MYNPDLNNSPLNARMLIHQSWVSLLLIRVASFPGSWHSPSTIQQQQYETDIQPLCSRCRTNQVLLLNYKANYFPEDEEVRVAPASPTRTLTEHLLRMTGSTNEETRGNFPGRRCEFRAIVSSAMPELCSESRRDYQEEGLRRAGECLEFVPLERKRRNAAR
jgi:hypothetical protein